VLAVGAAALGIYVAGAPGRAQHAFVVRYVTAWKHTDYAAMYALLDPAAHSQISSAEFTAELREAAQTATLTALRPTRIVSIGNGWARVRFVVHTSTFGTLHALAQIPLVGSGGGTRVQFETSLLLPGLKPGQMVSRKATLGQRGSLLTANGELLASGDSLSTPIPDVADEIVGNIGSIPASRRPGTRRRAIRPVPMSGRTGLSRYLSGNSRAAPAANCWKRGG